MQGTRNNGVEAGGVQVVDLDALLASRLLEPASVKLGGKTWRVRTDLTAHEATRALAFTRVADLEGVFTYLVGEPDEVEVLDAALDRRQAAERDAAEARARGEKKDVAYEPLPYAKNAVALVKVLDGLPRMHSALAQARIYRASVALAEWALDDGTINKTYGYEPAGGSSAS